MTRTTPRLIAVLAATALVAAACGDDDGSATETDAPAASTTAGTVARGDTTDAVDATAAAADSGDSDPSDAAGDGDGQADGWTVNTEDCVDPDRANEPIEGTINIGSSAPLSGGPAAAAFAPVVAGMQAYIDYANENQLLPDHEIVLHVGDDQVDPALTPDVINGALDDGAHVIMGVIGTANNMAVRDLLNEECVPQLMAGSGDPALGEPVDYPWTTAGNLPYDVEAAAYADSIASEFPDGATVGLFYVNNDGGIAFKEAFEEAASESNIEIVDDQSIEQTETVAPTAQVSSIAGEAPDAIVTFPLGAQCPTFLGELANAKAANAGWEPRVYLTNSCASPLILGIAGETADGLYTSVSSGVVDITNPDNHALPGVAAYLSYIDSKGLADTVPTSVAGWIWAEVTVEILRQAAGSPEGLTQASIINAARNLDYTPSVVRDGITYKMSGEEDAYYVEDVQIVQYDAGTGYLNDVGELISSFRSS